MGSNRQIRSSPEMDSNGQSLRTCVCCAVPGSRLCGSVATCSLDPLATMIAHAGGTATSPCVPLGLHSHE